MTNNMSSDPTVINQLAEKLLEEPAVEVKTVAPSSSDVTLPGGFVAGDGSVIKYAEVRELNGMD